MSRILVVGNILKDVYLNLDTRTANFETDANGINWLNLGFNTSNYHFFKRNSSFGGAVVSLEVLRNMGFDATIVGSKISFGHDGVVANEAASIYRYILVADETQVAYLTPSESRMTDFVEPNEPIDYIYIDRSVELTERVAQKIENYLAKTPTVKLMIYVKKSEQFHERRLTKMADLVFSEDENDSVSPEKLVLISEKSLKYQGITVPIVLNRPDLATHLSLYSTAAATILGAYILGKPMEEALHLAKANVENSQLDKTLNLKQLESLAADYNDDSVDSLKLVARSLTSGSKTIFDLAAAAQEAPSTYDERQEYYSNLLYRTDLRHQFNGVALVEESLEQFTNDGRSFVDYLTDQRVVPGILVDMPITDKSPDCKRFVTKFKQYYLMGVRFLKWDFPAAGGSLTEDALVEGATKFVKCCFATNLVPVIDLNDWPRTMTHKITENLQKNHFDTESVIIL
jgi:hypothetical protein